MKNLFALLLIILTAPALAIEETMRVGESENFILKEKNSESGVYDQSYNTVDDSSRFSAIIRTNFNVQKMDGLRSFEAIYAKKMELFWAEFIVQKTTARYECLTKNNDNVSPSNSDLEQSSSDLLTLGLGLSLRSAVVQDVLGDIFNTDRFFETTAAALTYNRFNDTYRAATFSGPGFRADYGIHYRAYPSFHMGPRFSYNLALVKKPAEGEGQTSTNRSLTLSWVSLGLDFSFYF